MAILLDERAQALITRRRDRGSDDSVYVRLERGSLRAGTPWRLVAGWASRRRDERAVVLRRVRNTTVYVDLRIARYALSHDLTISAVRLGPWAWLSIADPFAFERMREWEWEQTRTALPPAPPAITSFAEKARRHDLVGPGTRADFQERSDAVLSSSGPGSLDVDIGPAPDGQETRLRVLSPQADRTAKESTDGGRA